MIPQDILRGHRYWDTGRQKRQIRIMKEEKDDRDTAAVCGERLCCQRVLEALFSRWSSPWAMMRRVEAQLELISLHAHTHTRARARAPKQGPSVP